MRKSTIPGCLLLVTALVAGCASANEPLITRGYTPNSYLKQRVHKDVQVLTVGSGVDRAYVFIPKQPLAKGAPLVLFHHGWLGMNPKNFGGLIDLMVRRGAVVIYPVYQEGDRTSPQQVTEIAAKADVAALTLLKKRYPRLVNTKNTLYFGFSMGASISLNFAMDPKRYGVPAPRALLLVAPGDAHHVAHGALAASIVDSSGSLPVDLPTVLVSGADDGIGVPTSRAIAARLCHLPADRRTLILFPSDAEGATRIQAGHGSPGSPDSRYDFHDPFAQVPGTIPARSGFEPSGSLNLLDYYGYWRVSTRLLDWVAGKSKYPAELFSNSLENRFLGTWPSGRAYTPAIVEDHCSR